MIDHRSSTVLTFWDDRSSIVFFQRTENMETNVRTIVFLEEVFYGYISPRRVVTGHSVTGQDWGLQSNRVTSWPFLTTGWAGGQKGPTAVVFFTLELEKKGRSPHCPISSDVCGWVRNEIALVVLCNTCSQKKAKKRYRNSGL
jgi:hypothetical protein